MAAQRARSAPPRRRSGGTAAATLALLAALALARGAAAMYEDQAGTFDWHREQIGEVVAASHAAGRDRFYVATAQGNLAALSSADGALAWRRAHPEGDALDAAIALSKPSVVVAASAGGALLRGWDAADGGFKWEAPLGGGGAAALAAVALAGGAGVAAVAGGEVQARSGASGELVWSAPLGAPGAGARLVSAAGGRVAAAAYEPR
jgi:outer membrane protein assembly factor BamB